MDITPKKLGTVQRLLRGNCSENMLATRQAAVNVQWVEKRQKIH